MESHVIDVLDRISARHGIDLVSVVPGEKAEVLMFEELPYDVEVRGEYFRLFDWFREVERELHPMVVKRFELAAGAEPDVIPLTLRLVAYRTQGPES